MKTLETNFIENNFLELNEFGNELFDCLNTIDDIALKFQNNSKLNAIKVNKKVAKISIMKITDVNQLISNNDGNCEIPQLTEKIILNEDIENLSVFDLKFTETDKIEDYYINNLEVSNNSSNIHQIKKDKISHYKEFKLIEKLLKSNTFVNLSHQEQQYYWVRYYQEHVFINNEKKRKAKKQK